MEILSDKTVWELIVLEIDTISSNNMPREILILWFIAIENISELQFNSANYLNRLEIDLMCNSVTACFNLSRVLKNIKRQFGLKID